MNPLNITSQKTAVLSENESRNSILPILEQAGFLLDFEKYSRTLFVSDGGQIIAKIIGVKGLIDIIRRSKLVPITWIGSDVAGEIFLNRCSIDKILETNIGLCTLQYIYPQNERENFSLKDIDTIFTKYPNYFKQVLRQLYTSDFLCGENAPENSPEDLRVWDLLSSFKRKVVYSDSPDTTLADFSQLRPEKRFAAWEIVQTGQSIQNLGLKSLGNQELIRKVSTDMYIDRSLIGEQKELFEYFLGKIQRALGEL